MVIPPVLKPGDTVAIVAPARKLNQADVQFAATLISSWQLNVVVGRNIYSTRHSYFSGSDNERLSDLQEAIDDPSVNCIISARGGYGSTRILDALDLSRLAKEPKWIVGFSDITALHLRLHKAGISSLHATMPVLFSNHASRSSVESLRSILMNGPSAIDVPAANWNKRGKASGDIIGGNLSLIVDSLGTNTEPDTAGKILFLEEVDEYLYKLDRMMTQLRRAGKLKDLAGLVVGHFTDIKDTELSFGIPVPDIILDAVSNYTYPVAFGFPSGHENPNLAWIHGAQTELVVADAVSFSQSVVKY